MRQNLHKISAQKQPHHRTLYLYNDNYVTFTSQVGTGEGCFQDSLSRRIVTVKNRGIYITDGEGFWNANGLPVEAERDEYTCIHGIGYTIIHTLKNGIASDYGLFVPNETEKTVGSELAWVTVKNCAQTKKTIKVISYIYNEFDGQYTLQGYNPLKVEGIDTEAGGIVYAKKFNYEGELTPGAMFRLTDGKITGYDRAQTAFIGTYGNLSMPKALIKNGGCTNSDCINEKMCYALEAEATLEPGEEKRILFLTGVVIGDREKHLKYAKRFFENGAFEKGEQELRTELGCVCLKPPYTHFDKHIGSMTSKAAGVQENGSVYLHTVAWKIAADAMVGRCDLVEKDICSMLPFRNPVTAGRGEPYILFNSYNGKETGYRNGTPGQSWRTASGQWFLKALVNYVFGLMPTLEGLTVKPCLPESWDSCSITKRFRKAVYNIEYVAGDDTKIEVDGKIIEGNLLPYEENKTFNVKVIF